MKPGRAQAFAAIVGIVMVGIICTSEASAESNPGQPAAESAGLGIGALGLAPEFQTATTRGLAQSAEYGRRYYKRKTYYTNEYQAPQQTVVVVSDPVPPPPQRIIVEQPVVYQHYFRGVSLSLRTVGISYGDTTLANGKLDGEDMAGVGVGLRYDLDPHWALEFAVDYVGGSSEEANVEAMPVTVSLMARLFPESILDLYGVAGGGIHYTKVDFNLPVGDVSYMRWGGHVGGGAELKLDQLVLTGDVRYLMLQAPPDGVPKLSSGSGQALGACGTDGAACTSRPQGATPGSAALVKEDVQDAVTDGVQFMLGLGYRW